MSLRLCVLMLSLTLTGCSTLSHKPASCSGYEQRPLNRSMWQWETTQPAAPSEARPAKPQSSAHFDEAGSRRPCGLV